MPVLLCYCSRTGTALDTDTKFHGCGYFLATRKAAKNQVILGVAAAEMVGNSRVIEVREEYPLV
jgi:hypothetical protein